MNASLLKKTVKNANDLTRAEKIGAEEAVALASDIVAPVWPLKNFIAVNPLQGLEHYPFEKAVTEAGRYRGLNADGNPGRTAVNRELIKWCTAFFDEGQATIAMPGRNAGFYATFADLVRFDARLGKAAADGQFLRNLPGSAAEAISLCLDRLAIPERDRIEFMRQSLAALPGWSGYVKWKSHWQSPAENARRPANLVEFMAVRLVLTCVLWPDAAPVEIAASSMIPSCLAELPSTEGKYRDALLSQLLPLASQADRRPFDRPKAQLIFCIDVRSEPFRRAIEARNEYETLGFAGFFGVAVRIKGYGDENSYDSCPVLLKPGHEIDERPCAGDSHLATRHEQGRGLIGLQKRFYQSLKYNFATPFALVEMLGPLYGLRMLAKTFVPTVAGHIDRSAVKGLIPHIDVTPVIDSISLSKQADLGEQALRMMGLTSRIAPIVVLCGHGSETENNAFASSLDCGACGGNHGGANARVLAKILNTAGVRSILAERGLNIPEDTHFVAALHDTTTDEMKLFGIDALPAELAADLAILRHDLESARQENSKVRCSQFGSKSAKSNRAEQETSARSRDWAQTRPEWGLARNAAFVVGPRQLTREANLKGRCFLHSYDWSSDSDGKFLATILTAPMVVAQWINSQYFFSTIDKVSYGAGSKPTQNVTGKIGVMQGNASDLMHGLPLQSVFATDDTPYHEPLRLLTVVYAPKSVVDSIVQNQDVLKKLFGNGWVHLACIDPVDKATYLLGRDLRWQSYDSY